MKKHKHCKLIKAWWETPDNPRWREYRAYRIKPAPARIVQYNSRDYVELTEDVRRALAKSVVDYG